MSYLAVFIGYDLNFNVSCAFYEPFEDVDPDGQVIQDWILRFTLAAHVLYLRGSEAVMQARLQSAARSQWPVHRHRIEGLAGRLHALDPRRVLDRGYAWLSDTQGQPLTSVAQVRADDVVQGVLADGVLQMRVTDVPRPRGRKPRAGAKT